MVLIFKALHILSMFTMVAVGVGGYSVYALAVRRRDIHALAAIHRTLARGRLVANVSALALLAGVVFGLLTALTAGFDFLTGWPHQRLCACRGLRDLRGLVREKAGSTRGCGS